MPPRQLLAQLDQTHRRTLEAAQDALAALEHPDAASPAFNLRGLDELMARASADIDAARETLLVAIQPAEAAQLADPLQRARDRGVAITTLCLEACERECGGCQGQIHRLQLAPQGTARWLLLVADQRQALIGQLNGAAAALVRAGGGAHDFSFSKALVAMLGQKTVNAEVAKLTKQYGKKDVNDFINGMTYAVTDGLKRATAAGVKLPAAPADLKGVKLAKTLVHAGTVSDGTFWSGYLFDHALSHPIHVRVMADIDAKSGHAADKNTHKVLNQAMYDVAQALGDKNVKLASLH